MGRQLLVVDYHTLCLQNQLDFEGVHKVSVASQIGVIISPSVVDCIAPVLQYKFGGIPLHNDTEGLVALWTTDKEDRDRFYMMCAYLLRHYCPDLWE